MLLILLVLLVWLLSNHHVFRTMLILLLLIGTAAAAEPNMPDPALTPGVARHDMTVKQMCAMKWGVDMRHVTETMKRKVFMSYGFPLGQKDPRCPCEIDHLISREVLGADVVPNLMVQTYSGPWNAHMKDQLENRLHQEVCAHHLTLKAAQQMLVKDWRIAYAHYFGSP